LRAHQESGNPVEHAIAYEGGKPAADHDHAQRRTAPEHREALREGKRFISGFLRIHRSACGLAHQPDQERRDEHTHAADDHEGTAPADIGRGPGAEGGADENAKWTVEREETDCKRTLRRWVEVGDHR